ncbi:NINE protein [Aureisphaera galaxeae]|uniref:NINE protein n=1 Tax=Aureisphaera galaxeae TaxID=1538023 RepID=UPI0023504517|nr:NINE protein [Aureisphaera galaxeae]MDC8005986.1 NINE protein [Aureisphaera galaxeae]
MSEEEDKSLGDDLKDKANEAANEAKETAKEFADEAKESAKEFKESWNEATNSGENKKLLAGLLALFLGSFGIHKFILGYQKEGIILAAITLVGYVLLCFGIGFLLVMATSIIGVVEGIIYLTKSDEEFYQTYQAGQKPWF